MRSALIEVKEKNFKKIRPEISTLSELYRNPRLTTNKQTPTGIHRLFKLFRASWTSPGVDRGYRLERYDIYTPSVGCSKLKRTPRARPGTHGLTGAPYVVVAHSPLVEKGHEIQRRWRLSHCLSELTAALAMAPTY